VSRPRFLRDLLLGARLALAGGRSGLIRTAMTSIGVGLGVALLLTAASIPAILAARHDRANARDFVYIGAPDLAPGDGTMLVARFDTDFRNHPLRGLVVQPEGARAPKPPGVAALPRPGEMVVSPALRRLLASPEGALLKPRLNYRIAGTIAEPGLSGPNDYAFYLGSDRLTPGPDVTRIDHFGDSTPSGEFDPILLTLTVIVFVVLLLPVAVFTAAAVRFGGESRDRRLAAVRLVGADSRMTHRIAAGEALLSAAVGVVVGAVFFFAGRQLVEAVTLWDISVFAGDLRPSAAFGLLVALAVPASAVAVTLLAMRRVVVEPLGVFRRSRGRQRRLWWRPIVPLLGLALLWPLLGGALRNGGTVNEYQVGAGVTLLLIGVTTMLPWLVESAVRRLGRGGLSWQLAVRRLQLDSATAARLVSGVAVAAAGTIALQMFFTGVQHHFVSSTGQDPNRAQVEATMVGVPATEVAARFRATEGVRGAVAVTEYYREGGPPLLVGDCDALTQVVGVERCAEGDLFVARGAEDPQWTVPAGAHPVTPRKDPGGNFHSGLFATPAAAKALSPGDRSRVFAYVRTDPASDDTVERVRNTAAAIDPKTQVQVLQSTRTADRFSEIQRGLLIGLVATLALIGASLLVSMVEQLQERRRLLAVLVAVGTRRATLGWSILWQTAVPVGLGLLLAAVVGGGVGAALLKMAGGPVRLNWSGIAGISGAAAAVVLLVTALSLPVLYRLMRPEGLRTE
jgi:hypothetical protein